MNELEVNPLRALILGVLDVVNLLVAGHVIPCTLSALVALDVVKLDEDEEQDVEGCDGHENAVAAGTYSSVLGK